MPNTLTITGAHFDYQDGETAGTLPSGLTECLLPVEDDNINALAAQFASACRQAAEGAGASIIRVVYTALVMPVAAEEYDAAVLQATRSENAS